VNWMRAVRLLAWLVGLSMAGTVLWLRIESYIQGRSDPPDLKVLELTVPKLGTDRAIVFVHGLDGHPIESFRYGSNGSGWAGLIREDRTPLQSVHLTPPLSSFAVYSIDYRRSQFSESRIDQIAQQVGDTLARSPIYSRHNHIWLVGHSLGGVVIKRVLTDYWSQVPQRTNLLQRTAGVILFAAPARGSDLAKLRRNEILSLLAWLAGRNRAVIKDLDPDEAAAFLRGADNDWRRFLSSRRASQTELTPFVFCATETDPVYGAIVVSEEYANGHCPDSEPKSIPADHFDIVKPYPKFLLPHEFLRDSIRVSASKLKDIVRVRIEIRQGGTDLRSFVKTRIPDVVSTKRDNDGLAQMEEQIVFASAEAEAMAQNTDTATGDYVGVTVADLIESLRERNQCIVVQLTPDRRRITLDVRRLCKRPAE